MKITTEPTPDILIVDGVPVRVWEGHTETGQQVWLMIHRVVVEGQLDDGFAQLGDPVTPPKRIQRVDPLGQEHTSCPVECCDLSLDHTGDHAGYTPWGYTPWESVLPSGHSEERTR